MKKLSLVLMLTCSIVFAQETITKNLGDFNELKVYNGLTVKVKKGSKSKVEISGSQSDDVTVKNVDGILKIRLRFPDSFTAEDVNITIFHKDDLTVLDANEGGKIIADEVFKQQHLEVRVQEGARINIDVDVRHLTGKAVSGGRIKVSGKTQNQNVEATTGGIYNALNLESQQTIVLAASGAEAEVNATEILDAKVRFGGSIYYHGKPEVLKTKKVIGGTIKPIK
jgi:hypothetical protein